jgi:hypothetical protein
MSNLWINWRFWYWHFQVHRDRPWVTFGRNEWRWERGECSPWIEFH